ncbi:hypothetical protein CH35J_010999 [Colletotrichum higginsianum]|uniref:Uncharacterized protein n=1 Tax=Colletotrichum higginsianum TaxID=80884 RepID=A0A4T0VHS9_9PEZI|nr:hypothetical protein CH35J_010999 [Colletotrichum higginsianum]
MKGSLILTLSYLITAVWAGGYQNCLERVWLFQSFLIDQHNPERDRQIGYQCNNWRQNRCVGNWVPCRGRQGRAQCNYDDFQQFLGNMIPGMPLQAAYRPDGSLDSQQTAVNCLWAWRGQNRPPFNFRGYKAVKQGRSNHNDFIYRIGQINNDNYNKPAVRAAAGNAAFSRVDDTLTKITQSRVADHGRHLIPLAQAGLPGVTIRTKDIRTVAGSDHNHCQQPLSLVLRDNERYREDGMEDLRIFRLFSSGALQFAHVIRSAH